MVVSIFKTLATALAVLGSVQGAPTADSESTTALTKRASFRDEFTTFNTDTWQCEYTCPVIEGEKARFRLRSGVAPDNYGSWSKARYKGTRFTQGKFTVSFSLTERPRNHPVWWGIALWDDGVDGKFSEINFGYTTKYSFLDSQLYFEVAKDGVLEPFKLDLGVDLYDEQYHEATLEYNADRVAFYFDGQLKGETFNKTVIPTTPMDFIIGPRLVTGSEPLPIGFTQSVDWVDIQW